MNNPESIRNFIRVLALSYPEVIEEFPWGDMAFKIRKKAFLFMGFDKEDLTFSVKLPQTGELALELPFTEPAGYGLGKHGWVMARISPGIDVSLDMISSWIDESYRSIAPKRLVTKLDANAPEGASIE